MNNNDGYVYSWQYVHYDDHLYHHGVKGQRWGVHRTAEQLGHYIKNRKIKKKRAAALEKARVARAEKKKQEEAKKQHEEARQKALKSGDIDEVLKFKGEYTNQELNDVIARLNYEQRLSNIKESQTTTGLDKFNNLMDNVDRINRGVEKGVGLYDTVAKINNAFNKDHKLPVVNLKGNDKKKDKNKNNKDDDDDDDDVNENTNSSKKDKKDKKDKKGKKDKSDKVDDVRETYGDDPNDWSDPKRDQDGATGAEWTRRKSSEIFDAEYTEIIDEDRRIESGKSYTLELMRRDRGFGHSDFF